MNYVKKVLGRCVGTLLMSAFLFSSVGSIDAAGGNKKKKKNDVSQLKDAIERNVSHALHLHDLVQDPLNPTKQELVMVNKIATLLAVQSEILAVLKELQENNPNLVLYKEKLAGVRYTSFGNFFISIKSNEIRSALLQAIPCYNGITFTEVDAPQVASLTNILKKIEKNSDSFNFVQATLARIYFDNSRRLLFKLRVMVLQYTMLYQSLDPAVVQKMGNNFFELPIIDGLQQKFSLNDTMSPIEWFASIRSVLDLSHYIAKVNMSLLQKDISSKVTIYDEMMQMLSKYGQEYTCMDRMCNLESIHNIGLLLTIACRHYVQLTEYPVVVEGIIRNGVISPELAVKKVHEIIEHKIEKFLSIEKAFIENMDIKQPWVVSYIKDAIKKIIGDDENGYGIANKINGIVTKQFFEALQFNIGPVLDLLKLLNKNDSSNNNRSVTLVSLPEHLYREEKRSLQNNSSDDQGLAAAYRLLGIKEDKNLKKKKHTNKNVSNKQEQSDSSSSETEENKDAYNQVDSINEGKQEVIEEQDSSFTEKKSLKEKSKKLNNKSTPRVKRINASTEVSYASRVQQYFEDEQFCSEKDYDDLFYHRFSKDVDTYLFNYGITYKRKNKTNHKKDDTVYEIAAEVAFDNGKKELVVFHATKDKDGICYHRGYDIKPGLFNEYFQQSYWKIAHNEDNFPKLGIKPCTSKRTTQDGIIKEDDLSVVIRDNYLGATYTLFKPCFE